MSVARPDPPQPRAKHLPNQDPESGESGPGSPCDPPPQGGVGRGLTWDLLECSLTLYLPTSPASLSVLLPDSRAQGTTLATRSSAQRIQARSRKLLRALGRG